MVPQQRRAKKGALRGERLALVRPSPVLVGGNKAARDGDGPRGSLHAHQTQRTAKFHLSISHADSSLDLLVADPISELLVIHVLVTR